MKEEKKVYPSQINTKAVACRVSTLEYVEILKEASQMGITVNDWLLMKIYEGKENNGLKKAINSQDQEVIEEGYKVLEEINDKNFLPSNCFGFDKNNNAIPVDDVLYHLNKFLILRYYSAKIDGSRVVSDIDFNEPFANMFMSFIEKERNNIDDLELAHFVKVLTTIFPTLGSYKNFAELYKECLENIDTNKVPSIQDAITQLQLIAKEEFEPKDYREFMKDLHELISDLR